MQRRRDAVRPAVPWGASSRAPPRSAAPTHTYAQPQGQRGGGITLPLSSFPPLFIRQRAWLGPDRAWIKRAYLAEARPAPHPLPLPL